MRYTPPRPPTKPLKILQPQGLTFQISREWMIASADKNNTLGVNYHLLNTFISKLGLSPTLTKSHPNYQSLRAYGVIAA
ncbi:hypothetical protein FACHB389_13400 [Nostoc calcicola FACHB-389]|nr:hypothetical protein [Nostoc calcicola FACHB-3891]OKH35037.1 hypothetical protein FACHB389_13400 [Nostoc calcicola FACHB-389]